MFWLYCKFYRVVSLLSNDDIGCYEIICNLVKWGEGGLQYDSLMTMPFNEVLAIHKQANRINKETKEEIAKAK